MPPETFCSISSTLFFSRSSSGEKASACFAELSACLYRPWRYRATPRKSVSYTHLALLDDGLQHLDRVVQYCLGLHTAQLPGAGAAGGMGCGMAAFFHSRLQMGIETVLDTVHFDRLLSGADMVFTGEGKIDSQSARGKVVSGVALRTAAAGVPLIAVVGDIGDGAGALYEKGVSAIFSINRVAVPYEEARPRAKDDLYWTCLLYTSRCV